VKKLLSSLHALTFIPHFALSYRNYSYYEVRFGFLPACCLSTSYCGNLWGWAICGESVALEGIPEKEKKFLGCYFYGCVNVPIILHG